jgi:hypothetical protein
METAKQSTEETQAFDRQGENAKASTSPAQGDSSASRRRILISCAVIFLVALGCRLLSWHDNRFEARKVQTAVTEGYKHTARLLQAGGLSGFFSRDSPLGDPNHLGHPPGYSILMATVFSLFGESDAALQIIQILADSLAAVVIFLIALALLNRVAATIAGLLVALAPQFTYNSVMLLPDSLSVLPILLAVYFFVRAYRRPRLLNFVITGALVGLSCWLRANALLLAPFMLLAIPLLFGRGLRMRYGLALVCGAVLIIAPLTIRNFIVYDHFIPVSLGAGQTLLEGISDYDEKRSLGIPNTDMGLMKWEAEFYKRPDYYGTLFNPDGVRRERLRLAQGAAVIRSHPFWFFGVMVRRAGAMLRLERVRLVSPDPPVTHSLAVTDETKPAWVNSPQDLLAGGTVQSKSVEASLSPDGAMLHLRGDEAKRQFLSAPISVGAETDYVLKLPIRIEQGRVSVMIISAGDNRQYASAIVEIQDWKTVAEQPLQSVELPFVSGGGGQVQIVIDNAGAEGVTPVLQIGQASLYALGPASFTWTRIPRAALRVIQKLFVTAVMLPLAIFGLVLLIRSRLGNSKATIVILLIVPAYYLSVQSALHTEYRYVLAVHYFLFVPVAAALSFAGGHLRRGLQQIPFLQRFFKLPRSGSSG